MWLGQGFPNPNLNLFYLNYIFQINYFIQKQYKYKIYSKTVINTTVVQLPYIYIYRNAIYIYRNAMLPKTSCL